MNNPDNHLDSAAAERLRQAEATVAREEATPASPPSPESTRIASQSLVKKVVQQPLHELRVHQIQLEMQNEELRRIQAELDATRARYFDLYDLAPVGYCTVSEAGLIKEANLTVATLLSVNRNELIQRSLTAFISPEDQPTHRRHWSKLFETGVAQAYELRMLRAAVPVWTLIKAAIVPGQSGAIECRVVLSDITEQKQAERLRWLAAEVLRILNEPQALPDAVQRILAAIRQETGFDSVGLRLRQGEDFTYCGAEGFSQAFLQAENQLVARAADGGLCRDENGKVRLECTCGLVLTGQTDPTHELFTPGGSAWTSDARQLLRIPPEQDPRLHPRNRCIHEGYQSLALIPIRTGGEIAGLLQLNDRRPGCFTLELVQFFEGLAASVGVALLREQTAEALRASEDRYRRIVETAEEGIWMVDAEWKTTFANARMERLLGCAPGQMMGRKIDEFMDEEGRQIAARLAQRRERGINEDHDFKFIRQNGTALWAIVATNSFLDQAGGFAGALAMITDITERKHAEDALRERNREIAAFNDAMVGRELRMIELKTEINELCQQAGQARRYEVEEERKDEVRSEKSEIRNPKSE
jgi:PAS domain S-box-containing protein